MSWLPGWGSAESAEWWSHLLFWLGLVCFVLLGATLFGSHLYAVRRAQLMADIAAPSDLVPAQTEGGQAGGGQAPGDGAAAAGATPGGSFEEAKSAAPGSDQDIAPPARHLARDQYLSLVAGLKRLPSHHVVVSMPLHALESVTFAAEFVSALQEGGWTSQQVGYSGQDLYGVQVTVNAADARAGRFPPGAQELIAVLLGQGLSKSVFTDAQVRPGTIELRIGLPDPPQDSAPRQASDAGTVEVH